jgi:hypothetical protein
MRSTPRCEQFVRDEICLVHCVHRRKGLWLRFERLGLSPELTVLTLLTLLTSLTSLTLLMGGAFHSVSEVNSVNNVNSIARKSHIPNGYRYA